MLRSDADLIRREAVARVALPPRRAFLSRTSRFNDDAQAALFSPTRLAPTCPESTITRPFPFNACCGEDEVREVDGDSFRLEVGGLVAGERRWTLADLNALPQEEQIRRHLCVEGWSAIGRWGGVPFATFLKHVGADLGRRTPASPPAAVARRPALRRSPGPPRPAFARFSAHRAAAGAARSSPAGLPRGLPAERTTMLKIDAKDAYDGLLKAKGKSYRFPNKGDARYRDGGLYPDVHGKFTLRAPGSASSRRAWSRAGTTRSTSATSTGPRLTDG